LKRLYHADLWSMPVNHALPLPTRLRCADFLTRVTWV
jgi:hypothetical protein